MNSSYDLRRALLPIKKEVCKNFSSGDWLELATLTNSSEIVEHHPRLLRSLSFGDDDYEGNVFSVLVAIAEQNPLNLGIIQNYISDKNGESGLNISSTQKGDDKIYFTPTVFQIPDGAPEANLLAVMMPFAPNFTPVYEGIKQAATHRSLRCQRADDIWENSNVIQDVFSLIYRSYIVVCDFTDKNPNVFYEAGIAHTLGKHVVPITQHQSDIPFDLQAHRYIRYLNNAEGIKELQRQLDRRIEVLLRGRQVPQHTWGPRSSPFGS
ncbi:hypothetical protein RQ734_15275 [Roseomonas mucosa]|uniref:hypothetical protein n=1 Tax=Roseomonas mucosa TaxID=207340 RepID=UPI0028CD16CA|nr:hypothetical protein [Roseomonas mucosa]MDT8277433.1 hypothetical protein [Roseomonas mucosa]